MPTVTERLAERLLRPVAEKDRQRAALHVLDWAGCAVAGANAEAALAMGKSVKGLGEGATDLHAATLYLGALGNVLEMDDVDKRALLHPGPVVIPAALTAAIDEKTGAENFLDGIVRGYEAVIRIGRAVGPAHYRYWHNTGTCGPFGAAASAASIYELHKDGFVNALGLAGTQASGFWQTRHESGSHAKQLHTARAAHSGWLAATLARSGFVGVRSILEGEQGFFTATCGDANAERVLAFNKDDEWTIHDVSFKPWPACRHAHAAIDAALALRESIPNWRDAESFTVRTYKDAILFCDNAAPADTLSAKFSLQHAVALTLLRGRPSLEDFEGAVLTDPEISNLRDKIAVMADENITALYPARFGAAIDLDLQGKKTIDMPDALGDPENPVSNDQIIDKARMLMAAGGLSDRIIDDLCACALSLPDNQNGLTDFWRLLAREALL